MWVRSVRRHKIRKTLFAAASAAMISGCSTAENHHARSPADNRHSVTHVQIQMEEKQKAKAPEPLVEPSCRAWEKTRFPSYMLFFGNTVSDVIEKMPEHGGSVKIHGIRILKETKNLCALPYLFRELEHGNPEVRLHAMIGITSILGANRENPKAAEKIPALIEIMAHHKHKELRPLAFAALGQMGLIALPALIETLQSDNPEQRVNAAKGIEVMAYRTADKTLLDKAVAALMEAAKDPYVDVQNAAFVALGAIGDKRATPLLADAVRYPYLAQAAIQALVTAGDERALPILRLSLTDEDPFIRRCSAQALGAIGHADAAPALLHALDDEHWMVREEAAAALGKIVKKNPSSAKVAMVVPALIRLLRDPEMRVRFSAGRALQETGDKRALLALREASSHSDDEYMGKGAKAVMKTISK